MNSFLSRKSTEAMLESPRSRTTVLSTPLQASSPASPKRTTDSVVYDSTFFKYRNLNEISVGIKVLFSP